MRQRLQKQPATATIVIAIVAAFFGALMGSVATYGWSKVSRKEKPVSRPAAISVSAVIVEKSGISFAEKGVTKRYDASYEETLTTFLLGSLSDLPLVRVYDEKGLFEPGKLSALKKDREVIEQHLRETKAIFYASAVFANSGEKSATLKKIRFAFPTNTGDPWIEEFADQSITVDENSTKAQLLSFQMPLFLLLGEKLTKSGKSVGSREETSSAQAEEEAEQFSAVIAAKLKNTPFINLREKVQVTLYDQSGQEFRSEADFSKLLAMLDTQRPPDFKKRTEPKKPAESKEKIKPGPKGNR